MKRTVAIATLAGGALLAIVPRFVLPPCEYRGFPAMHCSDTMRGEIVAGAVLLALGVVALAVRGAKATIAVGVLALAVVAVAFALPDQLGYCHSSRMPCTYGMVPAVRFIVSVTALAVIGSFAGTALRSRRKGAA